jgi:hypothetical protein
MSDLVGGTGGRVGIGNGAGDNVGGVGLEAAAAKARSVRTIAEQFSDVCELATAGRTATMLDHLVDDTVLTPAQRARRNPHDLHGLDAALPRHPERTAWC